MAAKARLGVIGEVYLDNSTRQSVTESKSFQQTERESLVEKCNHLNY